MFCLWCCKKWRFPWITTKNRYSRKITTVLHMLNRKGYEKSPKRNNRVPSVLSKFVLTHCPLPASPPREYRIVALCCWSVGWFWLPDKCTYMDNNLFSHSQGPGQTSLAQQLQGLQLKLESLLYPAGSSFYQNDRGKPRSLYGRFFSETNFAPPTPVVVVAAGALYDYAWKRMWQIKHCRQLAKGAFLSFAIEIVYFMETAVR